MVKWTTFCLFLTAPAAFALSAHAHGSRLRCPLRSPSSVQCHEQWPDDPHPEALAELPQGEEHPRAELPGAELLSRTLLNPKVDVALGIPVVVSASIFAVQTLALGGDVGGFYFSPLEVFNFLENVESSICIVFPYLSFTVFSSMSIGGSFDPPRGGLPKRRSELGSA